MDETTGWDWEKLELYIKPYYNYVFMLHCRRKIRSVRLLIRPKFIEFTSRFCCSHSSNRKPIETEFTFKITNI